MARRKRIHLPNATYHIMLRGNDGDPIFFSPNDRYQMYLLLQDGIEKFGYKVHAYCFMSNHVHFAIQVADNSVSKIIHNFSSRYTKYINAKHNRIGHLFQGRFNSILVIGTQYFKELIRYIHLNPVRARLVNRPEEYPWSSHRTYLQIERQDWITKDDFLCTFGKNRRDAICAYDDYICKGIGKESNFDFKVGIRGGIVADEEFLEKILERAGVRPGNEIELVDLVAKVCEMYGVTESALCKRGKQRNESHARAVLALLVRDSDNLSLVALGEFLRRSPSSISKLASSLENKCRESPESLAEIEQLRSFLARPKQR